MSRSPQDQRTQLSDQRRRVDFDTYDVTVDELIRRVTNERIEIAPVYQRQFRWEASRQSALIESILLGIPVPPLFMATNVTADFLDQWEVVDGLQRLGSLVNFAGQVDARSRAGLSGNPLMLEGLEKLPSFNGATFEDLPQDLKSALLDRPTKVIVLNDKSDSQVRFDLFERLNTGGVKLTDQEIRECVYRGEFIELLGELASTEQFLHVAKIPKTSMKDGTPEEWVLRFFAFHERYKTFDHSVKDFLNEFTRDATLESSEKLLRARRQTFMTTFDYLVEAFPSGITRGRQSTPVNLFEGIAVGAALALEVDEAVQVPADTMALVHSPELKASTTGATNSRPQVRRRIETSRDYFSGRI